MLPLFAERPSGVVRDYSILNIDVLHVYTRQRLAGPPNPLALHIWLLWFKLDVETLGGSRKDTEQHHGRERRPHRRMLRLALCLWGSGYRDTISITASGASASTSRLGTHAAASLLPLLLPLLRPGPGGRRRQGSCGKAGGVGSLLVPAFRT